MNQKQKDLVENFLGRAKKSLQIVISDANALSVPSLEQIADTAAMVPYESLASRFGRAVEVVSDKLFRAIAEYERRLHAPQ